MTSGGRRPSVRGRPFSGVRMIPVGGGKGGVGKTFLVANLAAALAREGYRVVAVDGDLEGANLHTCLGVAKPRCSLADFVAQREDDLRKLVLDTPIPRVQLIAATHGNLATPQPGHSRRLRHGRLAGAVGHELVRMLVSRQMPHGENRLPTFQERPPQDQSRVL